MNDRMLNRTELDCITSDIIAFRDERDWRQFHTPRNLAAALSVEASELQELLLWKTDEETAHFLMTSPGQSEVARELADVLIFALLFCNELGIEPIDAIRRKLKENANKYPVSVSRGNALKYTKLQQ